MGSDANRAKRDSTTIRYVEGRNGEQCTLLVLSQGLSLRHRLVYNKFQNARRAELPAILDLQNHVCERYKFFCEPRD